MNLFLPSLLCVFSLALSLPIANAKDQKKAASDLNDLQVELRPVKNKIQKIKQKEVADEEPGHDPIPRRQIPVNIMPKEPIPVPVTEKLPIPPPIDTSVPAEKALGWLKNGNARYLNQSLRKDGIQTVDRIRTLEGERPHTVIWTSSDSRIAPEVIFDQKLGEIYVVRNFGPSMNEATVASLEYAVQTLGAQLIVVMTQSHSEAVRKALQETPDDSMTSGLMSLLFNDLRPRLTSFIAKSPSPGFRSEAWALANSLSKDLPQQSLVIRNNLARGLQVKTALYDLETGKVEFR